MLRMGQVVDDDLFAEFSCSLFIYFLFNQLSMFMHCAKYPCVVAFLEKLNPRACFTSCKGSDHT